MRGLLTTYADMATYRLACALYLTHLGKNYDIAISKDPSVCVLGGYRWCRRCLEDMDNLSGNARSDMNYR